MILSMTGYGRAIKESGNFQVTVEMRAVNHRFSEVSVRMPKQFFFLEDKLKKIISRTVKRGKVDVFVHVQGEWLTSRHLSVDWELLGQYYEAYEKMTNLFDSSRSFPADQLLLHEEVVEVQEADDVSEEMVNTILSATEDATQRLKEMREKEGQSLSHDLATRIERLSSWNQQLKTIAPTIQELYRERLIKRVKEFVAGNLDIDEARILTEVAIYADKSDIQEEITRIDSHLKQFGQIIQQAGVVGRKLDFIVQELNREINTIGSKANDLTISETVVNMKSELEKIREQVQNIE